MQKTKALSSVKKEKIEILCKGIGICAFMGWLFTGHLYGVIVCFCYLPFYIRSCKKNIRENRKNSLRIQFRDAINSLAAALEAGENPENAVKSATEELKLMYSETEPIIYEFREISAKLGNNVTIEEAFEDFAVRSGIDDIMYFSEILSIAKRTGGNILQIIRETRNIITDKLELESRLKTMIAAKAYEAKIMKAVPAGILIYLRLFSYDLIKPLYTTLKGEILMLVLLIVYFVLAKISDRIVNTYV